MRLISLGTIAYDGTLALVPGRPCFIDPWTSWACGESLTDRTMFIWALSPEKSRNPSNQHDGGQERLGYHDK